MPVFSRRLNPLDSADTNASFQRLSDHIGYMQECIEFTHQNDRKKLDEMGLKLDEITSRLKALEGAGGKV